MQEKIVVLDFDIPSLLNKKIFIPAEAIKVSHTLLPVCYLYREAKKQGIELVTPDVFLNSGARPKRALLFSHLLTPYTERLIKAGAKPAVLTCQESPFVATRFFVNLRKITQIYPHSFLFSGMAKRASEKTIYHQMFFPCAFNIANFQVLPFGQKKLLTMISGNKRMGNWNKSLVLKLLYGFGVKEIYRERQKVISFLAERGTEFDLYGAGWDKGGQTEEDSKKIKKVYRGKVDDKIRTLRQYKFVFCFENSIFPGYVTEKIFDVMFAGCVPVYNGAPDIAKFVPKQAFLDVRDFKDYSALLDFIEQMDKSAYDGYIEQIRIFLHSPAFARFSQESFAQDVLEILNQEFNINV